MIMRVILYFFASTAYIFIGASMIQNVRYRPKVPRYLLEDTRSSKSQIDDSIPYDVVLHILLQYVNDTTASLVESKNETNHLIVHFCRSVNTQAGGNQVAEEAARRSAEVVTNVVSSDSGTNFECKIIDTNRSYDKEGEDLVGKGFFALEVAVQQTVHVRAPVKMSLNQVKEIVETGFNRGLGGRVKFRALLNKNPLFLSVLNVEVLDKQSTLSPNTPSVSPISSSSYVPSSKLPIIPLLPIAPSTHVPSDFVLPSGEYPSLAPSKIKHDSSPFHSVSQNEDGAGNGGPSQPLIFGAIAGGAATILVSIFFIFCVWFPCEKNSDEGQSTRQESLIRRTFVAPEQRRHIASISNSRSSDSSSTHAAKTMIPGVLQSESISLTAGNEKENTEKLVSTFHARVEVANRVPKVEPLRMLDSFEDSSIYTPTYFAKIPVHGSQNRVLDKDFVKSERSLPLGEDESDKDIATIEESLDHESQTISSGESLSILNVSVIDHVENDSIDSPPSPEEFDAMDADENFGLSDRTSYQLPAEGETEPTETKENTNLVSLGSKDRGEVVNRVEDELPSKEKRSSAWDAMGRNNNLLRSILEDTRLLSRSSDKKSRVSIASTPPTTSKDNNENAETKMYSEDFVADNHDLERALGFSPLYDIDGFQAISNMSLQEFQNDIVGAIDVNSSKIPNSELIIDREISTNEFPDEHEAQSIRSNASLVLDQSAVDSKHEKVGSVEDTVTHSQKVNGKKIYNNSITSREGKTATISMHHLSLAAEDPKPNPRLLESEKQQKSIGFNSKKDNRSVHSLKSHTSARSGNSRKSISGWSTGSSHSRLSLDSRQSEEHESEFQYRILNNASSLSSTGPIIDGSQGNKENSINAERSELRSLEEGLKQLELRIGQLPRTVVSNSQTSFVTGATQPSCGPIKRGKIERKTKRIVIAIPPGKLGIVLANRRDGKGTFVSEIRPSSYLYGWIQPGDKVIAIDDEDVSEMVVNQITSLMSAKSDEKRQVTFTTSSAAFAETKGIFYPPRSKNTQTLSTEKQECQTLLE